MQENERIHSSLHKNIFIASTAWKAELIILWGYHLEDKDHFLLQENYDDWKELTGELIAEKCGILQRPLRAC